LLRALSGTARFALGLVLVAILGAGLPLIWVWIGAQVQAGTRPTAAAIATVMAGMIVSWGLILVIASWFKARSDTNPQHRRFAWNRSLRDSREAPRETSFLENVVIATTLVTTLVVTIWFFLFGDPGVPGV
jgi:hypothetical protein